MAAEPPSKKIKLQQDTLNEYWELDAFLEMGRASKFHKEYTSPYSESVESCDEAGEEVIEDKDTAMFNNHRQQFLSMLPQEMWQEIVDKVDDADVENLYNSSPFFRQMLFERRRNLIFPDVWNIIRRQTEKQNASFIKKDFSSEDTDVVASLPAEKREAICNACDQSKKRVHKIHPGILSCRQVCKTLKKTIDQFLERPPRQLFVDKKDAELYPMDQFYCKYFHINKLSAVRDGVFVTDFDKTHRSSGSVKSPFISGAVKLDFGHLPNSDLGDQQLFAATENLFRKFGKFIHHFSIDSAENRGGLTADDHYDKLKTLLDLLPNLESLEILDSMKILAGQPTIIDIIAHPLPKLEKLEFLSAKNLTAPNLYLLLRRNNHISKLEMETTDPVTPYIYSKLSLPNLTELKINFDSEEKLHAMSNCLPNWPVQKVNVSFSPSNGIVEPVDWSGVFSALTKMWSKTLTHLELALPPPSVQLDSAVPLTLGLAHLKSLKLTTFGYSSLDFLLPLKNTLEHLEIHIIDDANNGELQADEGDLRDDDDQLVGDNLDDILGADYDQLLKDDYKELFRDEPNFGDGPDYEYLERDIDDLLGNDYDFVGDDDDLLGEDHDEF